MAGVCRKFATPGAVIVAVVVTAAAWQYRTTSLPRNFAVVEPGVLYRAGEGKVFQIQNVIRDYRIKTILCLRKVRVLEDERKMAEANQVAFVYRPIDSEKPVPESKCLEFLKMVKDPARTPILVHCAQGKHRTGFFVAVYRMVIDKWPLDRALKEMESHGFDLNSHTKLIEGLKAIDPERLREKLRSNS